MDLNKICYDQKTEKMFSAFFSEKTKNTHLYLRVDEAFKLVKSQDDIRGWGDQDSNLVAGALYLNFSHNLVEVWLLPFDAEKKVIEGVFNWLSEKLPSHSTRIEIPIPQGENRLKDTLRSYGWEYYYTVQAMELDEGKSSQTDSSISTELAWQDYQDGFFDSYYETLVTAFESRPGICIPPYETQRKRCRDFGKKLQILVRGKEVVAFVRVEIHSDGSGELVSLARRPSERGKGLGEKVVMRGIETVRSLGAKKIALEVTLANSKALNLYERLGFHRTLAMDTWKIESNKFIERISRKLHD